MTFLQILVDICLVISALVMIVTVLLQSSDSDGMNALGGGSSETFFGKNKNATFEGKLALATKVSAGVFVVLALLMIFIG